MLDEISSLLESYATRGVFRGFARGAASPSRATFKITWHRDRLFELTVDTTKRTLRLPSVLPAVSPVMFRELKAFIASRQSDEVPEHRRTDPARATIQLALRKGEVSLTMTSIDADFDYATRKLISLVHEIYLVFLHDGRYYDYLIETFNLDPDHIQFT